MTWEELSVYAELVAKANKKQRQLEALFNDINRNSIHDNEIGRAHV